MRAEEDTEDDKTTNFAFEEEEEEEVEEYDVDAVFDDFATREARCKVVCFVVIFASSHATFRMPFALLFIHIVILFRFRADKNENAF